MVEKLTGKELVIKVLKDSDEPMSCTEIFDTAKKSGYLKLYAPGTDIGQKKAQISSLLSTWSESSNDIIKHKKGHNENTVYTYSLVENENGDETEKEVSDEKEINDNHLISKPNLNNTQINDSKIPYDYVDYNPTPDKKTKTCALLNGEILQWIDLLSKYNLNHVDGRSAHTEWDEYFKCKKDLPEIKVLWKLNNDEQERINEQKPLKLQKEKLIKENDKNNNEYENYEEIVPGGNGRLHINTQPIAVDVDIYTLREKDKVLDPVKLPRQNCSTPGDWDLSPGMYKIKLTKSGYKEYNKFIHIYKSKIKKIEIGLIKLGKSDNYIDNNITLREPISQQVKMYVWQRDKGKCTKCGKNEKLEYDHIIPVAKGGSDTERNIRLLCESCNRTKGANI